MKNWIKIPASGQFRGEGTWVEFGTQYPMSSFTTKDVREEEMKKDWEWLVNTGYLPTMTSENQPE